jgi:hypothetical protein
MQNRLVLRRLERAGTGAKPRSPPSQQLGEIAAHVAEFTSIVEAKAREMLGECLERVRA